MDIVQNKSTMASREFEREQGAASDYGMFNNSSSKNFLNEYSQKYDKSAYIGTNVEKDNRDDIDLDELNELLGLN